LAVAPELQADRAITIIPKMMLFITTAPPANPKMKGEIIIQTPRIMFIQLNHVADSGEEALISAKTPTIIPTIMALVAAAVPANPKI
jgi:hypothetical protein